MARARFGSWRAALERIGISGVRVRRYAAQELMDTLERVWRELGRPPGNKHLARRARITDTPYKRYWGTLKNACEQLAKYHAGEITREKLLAPSPPIKRRRRKLIPVDVRWRILKRDNHRCICCGANPATDPTVELQIDHIVPVSKGGGNEEGNLRTLCRKCNGGKGAA
jgi:hypothetical protein